MPPLPAMKKLDFVKRSFHLRAFAACWGRLHTHLEAGKAVGVEHDGSLLRHDENDAAGNG